MARKAPSPTPQDARPLVLGVLGGIASGKSAVARLLAGEDGEVVAADTIAQEVLDSSPVQDRLRKRYGARAFRPDGAVDRAFLAARVFGPGNEAARRELESWTHPLVRDRIHARLGAARASGARRVVLDVPLLLENDAQHGLGGLCDVLVFVDVDDDERDRRARTSRGWPEGEVARREAAQLPLHEKKKRAHHVIANNQGLEELERAVQRLAHEIERAPGQKQGGEKQGP